jgi:c-di-GMP-binding flagellar brake protein YcgR
MIKERRKRTRVPIGFDITILFQQKKIKVQTINISLTGISCMSSPVFRAGEHCAVILSLNPETSLTIQGNILRVDDKEAIISFLSMDEDTFYHLKRLLQYNAADPDTIDSEIKDPAFV